GLGGIRDVLLDQAQATYLEKFKRVDSDFRNAQAFNAFIGAAPRYVIEAVGMVLSSILAVALSRRPGGIEAALPALWALALGAARLLPLLQIINTGWAQIAGNRHNLIDILTVLELPISPSMMQEGHFLQFERAISLEAVSFSYQLGETPVLKDVNLTIKKG